MKNPLYRFIFIMALMVILTLYMIANSYGAEYEVNDDNEIISGTIPEDYEGAINGQVSLSDGTTFEGKAEFKDGEMFIESGNLNGLALEHGIYSRSGSISIEGIGKINGIAVSNVINVRREVNGFSGYATEEVPTIVQSVRIQPAGTFFQYPSRSGQGVTITASAVEAGTGRGIPTRVTMGDFPGYYLEIESGKQIELEPDGSYTTEMYGLAYVFIPSWNGGSLLLNPRGKPTEGHHDLHQHTIRTAEGEIATTDSYGREYHFTAREGFTNDLTISGEFIQVEGGWKFDVNAADYTLEGVTGLYYDNEAYHGSVMLEPKETLAVSGENLLTRVRASNDFSLVSEGIVVNGIGGGVFHYISPFSPELATLMESSFPGSSGIHHSGLLNQMEDHHPQQIAEEPLSSNHDHTDGPVTSLTGTSNHETHSSTTDVHNGMSAGAIHGHGEQAPGARFYIGDDNHKHHGGPMQQENDPSDYLPEEPSLEFGLQALGDGVGGSLSYEPFNTLAGGSLTFGSLAVETNVRMGESSMGGHHDTDTLDHGLSAHGGHDMSGNYKLSMTYEPAETVLGYTVRLTAFYEGESAEDHATHVDHLNPHSLDELEEGEHDDHDEDDE